MPLCGFGLDRCFESVPAFCLEREVLGFEPVALRFEELLAFRAEPAAFCVGLPAFRADPAVVFCFELVAFGAEPAAFCVELPAFRADPAVVFFVELVAFRAEPAAFCVFGDAAMSVLLPSAPAPSGLTFPVAVAGELPDLIPGCLKHTLRLVLGTAFLHVPDKLRKARLLL